MTRGLNNWKRAGRKATRLLAVIVMVSALGGCSLYLKENRRLMNSIDNSAIAPESKTAQTALLPVTVPLSIVAITIDGVFVQGAVSAWYAGKDTGKYIWPKISDRYLDKAALAPFQLIVTPPVFVGDLLWRWTLPFTRNVDEDEMNDILNEDN